MQPPLLVSRLFEQNRGLSLGVGQGQWQVRTARPDDGEVDVDTTPSAHFQPDDQDHGLVGSISK